MDPSVQVLDPTIEVRLVVLPSQPIDPGRCISLQSEECCPKHWDTEMVEERGEPLLPSLPCCPSFFALRLVVRVPAPGTRFPGPAPGACFAGSRSPRPCSLAPPTPPPVVWRCSSASLLSGRRRRARLLSRWPPSAAQTERAVFPHPAFTKTKLAERQWKGSSRLGSQARTHRRAYCVATFSNRSSATYGADATRFAAPAIRRAGGRAFGRGPACSGGPSPARRD